MTESQEADSNHQKLRGRFDLSNGIVTAMKTFQLKRAVRSAPSGDRASCGWGMVNLSITMISEGPSRESRDSGSWSTA